jgi:putative ABC transport system ATP-binding protein
MKKLLECQNLCKSFGKKQILKDVSFEIDEGDILAFIGPNGSGKTTTIKLILGLQNIDKGKVTINGFDIEKDFVKSIEKVGAIVENPDTYMYLTGWQNLKLTANLYKDITDEKIKEIVKLVELEGRINDKVSKYSLGMRQRLGIARALINEPKLILADEPTGALDSKASRLLLETMSEINKKMQATILMVTHDPFSASFCERILFLKDGKIFNEIFRGEKSRKDFFNEILDILTLLGGEVGNVR